MIAEKASEKSFRDLVHELVIERHGLTSTFYEASTYPESVIKRLAHGYFENEACADYQPQCKESWNLPIVGRTCARPAPPGCNRPAVPSPAPATSIAGCAPFSAGRGFHRSSNKNGLGLSGPKQASRTGGGLPITRKASPVG